MGKCITISDKEHIMAAKFCPFGFYSFYVNKQAAQAGGCHLCVEEKCALWETYYDERGNTYGQCAVLSIGESLRSMSDNAVGTRLPTASAKAPSSGIKDIFARIRGKKNKEATAPAAAPEAAPATTATTPAAPATTAAPATITLAAAPTTAPVAAPATSEKKDTSESTATPAPPPAAPLPPIADATVQAVVAPSAEVPVPAPPAPPPPAPPPPPVPETQSKAKDDYSDLLTPPEVPLSELPVISTMPKPTTSVDTSNEITNGG